MSYKLTVIDIDERKVLSFNEPPRWAHKLAREHAKATGNRTVVMKPVAGYERATKVKRFR